MINSGLDTFNPSGGGKCPIECMAYGSSVKMKCLDDSIYMIIMLIEMQIKAIHVS